MNRKAVLLFLLLSVFLMGADQGRADHDERSSLGDQRLKLQKRIEVLRREQDYLLFQQAMFNSDSRYLIIDMKKRTGRLKYKDRVLKDFRFQTSKNFYRAAPGPGLLRLTKKMEGKKGRHALVFGDSLIVQWKRDASPQKGKPVPFITITKKELQSIFYAVEEGAPAYLVR